MSTETRTQITLGIVHAQGLAHKTTIMQMIKDANLVVVREKSFDAQATLPAWAPRAPACAFVLQGPDAVQRWLELVGSNDASNESIRGQFGAKSCYASQSPESAKRDVRWMRTVTASAAARSNLKRPQITGVGSDKASGKTVAGAAGRPKGDVMADRGRTGPLGKRGSHTPAASPAKQSTTRVPANALRKPESLAIAAPARSRAGATPPTSRPGSAAAGQRRVLAERRTGRTSAPQTVMATKPSSEPSNPSESSATSATTTATSTTATTITDAAIIDEALMDQVVVATKSGTTVCSSDKDETESEHDAEIVAAMWSSKAVLSPSGDETPSRASFSPNSVGSIPRPETPEVDQLRQRFESLTHSPPVELRRQSTLSPDMNMRIKELRPKDPAGSNVKNLVDFFMDESRHQWEF